MHYTAKMLAQEHAKRHKMLFKYTDGLKEMLQEIRTMPDNAPIFPIDMSFYYEQNVCTVYRILMKNTRKSPYFNAGMDRVCYNKDVLTITKLDIIITKYPMATWDYGFGN